MNITLIPIINSCLKEYYICPKPLFWNDFFKLLLQYETNISVPTPLILSASRSPDEIKRLRLIEQLKWAQNNDCLEEAVEFLQALPEKAWHINRFASSTPSLLYSLQDKDHPLWETVTLFQFLRLGKGWLRLKSINPEGVNAILSRNERIFQMFVRKNHFRLLEYYLFKGRKMYRHHLIYQKYLNILISHAENSNDDSLLESLIIILEKEILKYPILFNKAMKKMKNNKQIHRALYNTVRETIPEVRNYVGIGGSMYLCR